MCVCVCVLCERNLELVVLAHYHNKLNTIYARLNPGRPSICSDRRLLCKQLQAGAVCATPPEEQSRPYILVKITNYLFQYYCEDYA